MAIHNPLAGPAGALDLFEDRRAFRFPAVRYGFEIVMSEGRPEGVKPEWRLVKAILRPMPRLVTNTLRNSAELTKRHSGQTFMFAVRAG